MRKQKSSEDWQKKLAQAHGFRSLEAISQSAQFLGLKNAARALEQSLTGLDLIALTVPKSNEKANTRFIAAANPSAIIELLNDIDSAADEIDRLAAENERLREQHDKSWRRAGIAEENLRRRYSSWKR
ncbi:ead/Ea22-like family protein [Ectopseudomonas mendocina]|uniref:Ead/Ea22-like family protein n=1 Tax=Ectopseudomonas mendocina TaxID=300 RepID=A0ABZ2RIQ2_ECTME